LEGTRQRRSGGQRRVEILDTPSIIKGEIQKRGLVPGTVFSLRFTANFHATY
jgi:hypothetical protein